MLLVRNGALRVQQVRSPRRLRYDAWGNPETTGGLTSYTPVGFAGGYTDPTGLVYLIHRYFDPSTGQFLSVDPLVDQTGQPYAYTGDDPVNGVDPLGLWSLNPISDVTQAWNDTGGKAVHYAATHPKEAIGIGLGVLSVATGGIGLAADVAFEGTLLTTTVADATAFASGAGAAYLDTGSCLSGDHIACLGAGLGIAGVLGAAPSVVGDILGVQPSTLPFALIKGFSAFGLLSGLTATEWDSLMALWSTSPKAISAKALNILCR
jgi:RHS repeat-associated protein